MGTTKTQKSETRMVETWELRMKTANHRFAIIKTTNAIYDRVVVIVDLPTMLTIQFPKGSSRHKNLNSAHTPSDNVTIKQENISKRDIVDMRYYKD